MQILVIEYGIGGFSRGELIEEILLEGYAMLRALIEDLKKAGHYVITTIDSRLRKFCQLVADEIIAVPKDKNPLKLLKTCLNRIDGAIIIAPALKKLYTTSHASLRRKK